MRTWIPDLLGRQKRPRLTIRGALILLAVFLTIGPVLAFGFGMPLDLANGYVAHLLSNKGHGPLGSVDGLFWTSFLMSFLGIVTGLPFYGPWAIAHLWPLALWIACCVILVASSRRGIRVRDAALIGASAVLVFPVLVDADSPHLTWDYPDAVFMAAAAGGGAALCTAIVRGLSEVGMRKRVEWGWLA